LFKHETNQSLSDYYN